MSKEDKTKVVKKFICSTCHGTGKVVCSKCGGEGERVCPHCGGTGHACPVCTRGYVSKTRLIKCKECYGRGYTVDKYDGSEHRCSHCGGSGQVKEKYKEICPNCHGDYTKTDHVCDECGGRKKIYCPTSEKCPDCGGRGKWSEIHDKVSEKNLRIFFALGALGGVLGFHYAYIRRWFLFLVQAISFLSGLFLIVGKNIAVERFGLKEGLVEVIGIRVLFFAFLFWFLGLIFVKRDGAGGRMMPKRCKNWLFWLLFFLFGYSGAHIAYGCSWLRLVHSAVFGFFSFCIVACVNYKVDLNFKEIFPMIGGGIILGIPLIITEYILVKFFDDEFLKKNDAE